MTISVAKFVISTAVVVVDGVFVVVVVAVVVVDAVVDVVVVVVVISNLFARVAN